ncbi:MAG: alpha/beta hydrolase-fold protein [Steroidobacteraceae bacterium]|jgi:predicted alpha/beta superfamily hydrolase|nr:alpha/beta hydrolase-fold protein [Steroidobacteraceae bacterium]
MKIISREPSNTLLRTEVWTVQPERISRPLLLTVTSPMRRPEGPIAGTLMLDGNSSAGLLHHATTYLEMGGELPPSVAVSVGYPLDAPVPFLVARNEDLTPLPWPEWDRLYGKVLGGLACPPSGRADAFLAVLTEELKPALEGEFGIDPRTWTLVGHSLGGLFATHALLSSPAAFRRYLAVGSSFWWRRPSMFERAESFGRATEPVEVDFYVAAGEFETADSFRQQWAQYMHQPEWQEYVACLGGFPNILEDTRRLAELVGRRPGCRVLAAELAGDTHSSEVMQAVSRGLRWLNRPAG